MVQTGLKGLFRGVSSGISPGSCEVALLSGVDVFILTCCMDPVGYEMHQAASPRRAMRGFHSVIKADFVEVELFLE